MRHVRLLGTALLLVTFGLVATTSSAQAGDAFAVDDTYTVGQDSGPTLLTPDVTANDVGVSPSSLFITTQPTHGSITADPPIVGHNFSYTPFPGFSGDDSFTYQFLGLDNGFHTATVTMHVTHTPGSPEAVNDTYTVAQDSGATVLSPDVTANDSGILSGSVFSNTPAAHGSVTTTLPITGHDYTYTPAPGFNGDDSFTYTFTGTDLIPHTGTVAIHVTPTPGAPQAVNDVYTVTANTPTLLAPDVTSNDTGIGLIALFLNSQPFHGTVTSSGPASHDYTYTPTPGFTGDDSFTYSFLGTDGLTHVATVTLHVVASKAVDDSYTVAQDSGTTLLVPDVTANDTGIVPITPFTNTPAGHGTVTTSGDFTTHDYSYKPNPGFFGDDSFTYTYFATDSVFRTATVTIHVTPTDVSPHAVDDEYTVDENSVGILLDPDVTANDVGINTTSPAFTFSQPDTGTVITNGAGPAAHDFVYTPEFGFVGDDHFNYSFLGVDALYHTGVVTIHVKQLPGLPHAVDDEYTIDQDSGPYHLDPIVTTNDVGVGPGFTTHSTPGHGAVNAPLGTFDYTYTPEPGFHGDDTFTYTFIGTDGLGHNGTVTMHVLPVETGPHAVDDEYTIDQDSGPYHLDPIVTANDVGVTSGFYLHSTPGHGTVNAPLGTFDYTYTPNPGFHGDDTFTYTFIGTDGLGHDGTVTIHVLSPPPVTAADDSSTVTEDTAPNLVTGNVLTNDNAVSGVLAVTNPGTFNLGHGSLVLNANGTYTYTLDNSNAAVNALNDGQTLTDTFTYNVSNGQGDTGSASLKITIKGKTDPTPVEFTVTGSQTFGGSPSFSYSSSIPGVTATGVTCSTVNPGSVAISPTLPVGSSYTLADCTGTVDAPGYAPTFTGGAFTVNPEVPVVVAVPDTSSVTEDASPNSVTGNVLTNDTTLSGTLGVTNAGTYGLDHGTLVINADGSYTYTLSNSNPAVNALNNGQTLTDTWTYEMSNGEGNNDSASLDIAINGHTDAPSLPAKKVEVDTDSSATVGHTITVKVSKLNAGEHYTVDIGGTEVKTGNADSKGKATFKVVVPLTLPAGQTLITVIGQEPNRTDSDRITIKYPSKLELKLDHSTVKPGKTQTVKVSNLIPGEDVIVTYDEVDLTLGHADSSGKFKFTFPVGTTEGTHTVMVSGDFGNRTATKTFKVKH